MTISDEAVKLREKLESAYDRDDLVAVMRLHAQLIMIDLNQLVIDSYRTRSEVVITDDALRDGGAAVVNVLVHEAVHAVAMQRSANETSRRDHRYHNGRFRSLGQQMGLVAGERHKHHGWSSMRLSQDALAYYQRDIVAVDAPIVIPTGEDPPPPSRLLLDCACDSLFRAPRRDLRPRAAICTKCGVHVSTSPGTILHANNS